MKKLAQFELEQSGTEFYSSHSGLALIGQCLVNYGEIEHFMSTTMLPLRHGISNADVIKCYLGQMCLGKNDFAAVTQAKGDDFFQQALGIKQLPSTETVRQRFDRNAIEMKRLVDASNFNFLKKIGVEVTPLPMGHVPVDMDAFPMDNSNTLKEGVSYTYKGHDGYTPMGAYLGMEGWNLACVLREGSQNSQKGFTDVLKDVIPKAKALTSAPLLVRLDSAHDALVNLTLLSDEEVDFIIKWNPRREDWVHWAMIADEENLWETLREGKEEAIFNIPIRRTVSDKTYQFNRVIRITKRTSDASGQQLNFTDGLLEGWWTSLKINDKKISEQDEFTGREIIDLYADHATSEQFHSEIKTDLDLERLPSGKFATNDLVLSLGVYAYNILKWIGLNGLMDSDGPVRHPAKRRRVRTVIQELMNLACRFIRHSGKLKIRFGRLCPAFKVFCRLYSRLAF